MTAKTTTRRQTLRLTERELGFLLYIVGNSTEACDDEEVGTIIGSREDKDIATARKLFYKVRAALVLARAANENEGD